MTSKAHPNDLELAALISSKICHDVISPVGAIHNGLELLDDEETPETQTYALDMIKTVTQQASAKLQFARFAFGAAGSAGSAIELDMARTLALGYVGTKKHTLNWTGPNELMRKDFVKLMLNLVACAVAALPRGGTIDAVIDGDVEAPTFKLTCCGKGAREPNFLTDLTQGRDLDEIDTMSIQAYYTWRLAQLADMTITITRKGDDVVIAAVPSA